jgi:isopentenyl diphosphate isomerase/L-lactate dehydrogenase-like FMN-dependent dehydrogenase
VVGTKYDAAESIWDATPAEWLRVKLGPAADAPKARDLGPADIGWLADVTGLPVVPKGVLHPEDARRAVDAGAEAIWVSTTAAGSSTALQPPPTGWPAWSTPSAIRSRCTSTAASARA